MNDYVLDNPNQDIQEWLLLLCNEENLEMVIEILIEIKALLQLQLQLNSVYLDKPIEIKNKPIEHSQLNKNINNFFIDITAGSGGIESYDLVYFLSKKYIKYFNDLGLSCEIIDINDNDSKTIGYKSISLFISLNKKISFDYQKFYSQEHGIHKMIRNSPYDAKNKRHTSFAGVTIYEDLNDEEQNHLSNELLAKKHLEISAMKASGSGGQHVNKTNSAIRIKHIPTGIVVECRESRCQHTNRKFAMAKLLALLQKQNNDKQNKVMADFQNSLNNIAFGGNVCKTYRSKDDFKLKA